MTKEEARIFLNGEESDIEDLYDAELFNFRQFFLSVQLIPSVVESRFRKMEKVQEAFIVLGGVPGFKSDLGFDPFSFSDFLLEAFDEFQKMNSILKIQIASAATIPDLIEAVERSLLLRKEYYALWPDFTSIQNDAVILGKLSDDMEFRRLIQSAVDSGIDTFEKLSKRENELAEALKYESKKLFLLSAKFNTWKIRTKN